MAYLNHLYHDHAYGDYLSDDYDIELEEEASQSLEQEEASQSLGHSSSASSGEAYWNAEKAASQVDSSRWPADLFPYPEYHSAVNSNSYQLPVSQQDSLSHQGAGEEWKAVLDTNKLIRDRLTNIDRAWATECVFKNTKLPVPFDSDVTWHAHLEDKLGSENLVYDSSKGELSIYPKSMMEDDLVGWLNALSSSVLKFHGVDAVRTFDTRAITLDSIDSDLARPRDIILMDVGRPESSFESWKHVYSFVEVRSDRKDNPLEIVNAMNKKSGHIFQVQPQRQFVLSLAVFLNEPKKHGENSSPADTTTPCGQNIEIMLVMADRSGTVYTTPFTSTTYGATTFLHILFGFTCGSNETLGWHPQMEIDRTTYDITHITVYGPKFSLNSELESRDGHNPKASTDSKIPQTPPNKFRVVRLLYSTPKLYGRGKKVWLVQSIDNGQFYVLKNSWTLPSNVDSEYQHLVRIRDALKHKPNGERFLYTSPTLYVGQENIVSTARPSFCTPFRHQNLIVTGPVCDPITSFRSKHEFVSVMIDIVNTLEFLSNEVGVVHRDISINNIMINRVLWPQTNKKSPVHLRFLACESDISSLSDGGEVTITQKDFKMNVDPAQDPASPDAVATAGPEACGMLIDYDAMQQKANIVHQGVPVGTRPFIALSLLDSRGFVDEKLKHGPEHDLESLLHCMMAIATYTDGPGSLRKPDGEATADLKIPLNRWFYTTHNFNTAEVKCSNISRFDCLTVPGFHPYWKDFAPFIKELMQATYDSSNLSVSQRWSYIDRINIATHAAYRKILLRALKFYSNSGEKPLPYDVIGKLQVNQSKRQYESDTGTASNSGYFKKLRLGT